MTQKQGKFSVFLACICFSTEGTVCQVQVDVSNLVKSRNRQYLIVNAIEVVQFHNIVQNS